MNETREAKVLVASAKAGAEGKGRGLRPSGFPLFAGMTEGGKALKFPALAF